MDRKMKYYEVDVRPSRDDMLMEMAVVVSKRSTCNRLAVGAVVSRGGRVLSTGYNGPASGLPHCQHDKDEPCEMAIHAEVNALAWAARFGVATLYADLHITHMPCLKCAQFIINAGISRVVYAIPYRLRSGVELLDKAHVDFEQYHGGASRVGG
jgi:dCMP deaminase